MDQPTNQPTNQATSDHMTLPLNYLPYYLHSVICSALTSNQSNWFNANQEKRELSDGKSSHQRNSRAATMDVPINIFFQ